jgi:dolichol-phosphate mannosyltransferase
VLFRSFYRLFAFLSYLPIPKDAGDFSLLDRRVVNHLLACPERDVFLRGLRAYVGFRQIGVDYVRPERMFGRSTNSLLKNFEWAKKAIFAYSRTPLNLLTYLGLGLFSLSLLGMLVTVALKLLFPEQAPRGTATILLAVTFFGGINLLASSILGEYLGKTMEEAKRRPRYIRRSLIRHGRLVELQ